MAEKLENDAVWCESNNSDGNDAIFIHEGNTDGDGTGGHDGQTDASCTQL